MALSADHSEGHTRVSVALCTYNGEGFLPLLLESICRQTLLPDEMVVCDDGSADATLSLLEGFARDVPFPVRISRNPETLRPAQNFAKCIAECEGDIIILTDQDDLWFPDRVANTAQAFCDSPLLTFAFSECPLIDQHGKDLGRSIYSSLPISAADRRILFTGSRLLPVLLRWGVLYGTTMAIRASLRPLFLPVPDLWSHDEWIGLVLSAVGPSTRLKDPVTHYRQHAGQQVGTGDWTIQTHLGLAQKHSASHYDSEVRRFEQAIAAARLHPALQTRLLPALEQKLAFLRNRKEVQTRGIARISLFFRMLFNGSYTRFSAAARSPLKDLLMNLRIFRSS